MAFKLISAKPGEPAVYLGSTADVSGSSANINAALPNAEPGTIVTTAGFATMKQLDIDGQTWKAVASGSGGGGGISMITDETETNLSGILLGDGEHIGVAEFDEAPTENSDNLLNSGVVAAALLSAIANLATPETSPATSAHTMASQEFITYNGKLYMVYADIAEGDILTPGTNIYEVTVGYILTYLLGDYVSKQNGADMRYTGGLRWSIADEVHLLMNGQGIVLKNGAKLTQEGSGDFSIKRTGTVYGQDMTEYTVTIEYVIPANVTDGLRIKYSKAAAGQTTEYKLTRIYPLSDGIRIDVYDGADTSGTLLAGITLDSGGLSFRGSTIPLMNTGLSAAPAGAVLTADGNGGYSWVSP